MITQIALFYPATTLWTTRRFQVGLVLSFAIHLAFVLGFSPASLHYIAPQPLHVEIRHVSTPQSAPDIAVGQISELTAEPAATSQPDPDKLQSLPQTPPAREAAVNLDMALDKYFTSRELDVRAEQTNMVDLIYPLQAYQMRIKGKVVLQIFINEHGGIDEIAILEAVPVRIFEEAALTATLALKFKPAVKNGRDVKSLKIIEVNFDPYESISIP
jgi:TonB family protein